jgi:predicted kinase
MEYMIILRGISGAGKSTFTKMLEKLEPSLVHCSADFIHIDPVDGVYRFKPEKLGEGHGLCFRTVIEALQRRAKLVVVDNTHTMNWELAPYVLAGSAFGYKTAFVRLEIDPATAVARNIHNVPEKSIRSMQERFQDPMRMWPSETKFSNPTEDDVLNFYAEFTR